LLINADRTAPVNSLYLVFKIGEAALKAAWRVRFPYAPASLPQAKPETAKPETDELRDRGGI